MTQGHNNWRVTAPRNWVPRRCYAAHGDYICNDYFYLMGKITFQRNGSCTVSHKYAYRMDYIYFLLNKMTRAPYALKCDVRYIAAVFEFIRLQKRSDLQ